VNKNHADCQCHSGMPIISIHLLSQVIDHIYVKVLEKTKLVSSSKQLSSGIWHSHTETLKHYESEYREIKVCMNQSFSPCINIHIYHQKRCLFLS